MKQLICEKNDGPLAPPTAPAGICKNPQHLNDSNQSELGADFSNHCSSTRCAATLAWGCSHSDYTHTNTFSFFLFFFKLLLLPSVLSVHTAQVFWNNSDGDLWKLNETFENDDADAHVHIPTGSYQFQHVKSVRSAYLLWLYPSFMGTCLPHGSLQR